MRVMPANRCDMCFNIKNPLVPVIGKADVRVCKACSYKANQVIGFLEYHGIKLQYELPEDIPKTKKRGLKELPNGILPESD